MTTQISIIKDSSGSKLSDVLAEEASQISEKTEKMTTILNVKVYLILKSPHKWVFHTAGQTLPVSCHSLTSLMLETRRRHQNRCSKRRSVTCLWLLSVTSGKQVKKNLLSCHFYAHMCHQLRIWKSRL